MEFVKNNITLVALAIEAALSLAILNLIPCNLMDF